MKVFGRAIPLYTSHMFSHFTLISGLVEPPSLVSLRISLPSHYTNQALNHCLEDIDSTQVCEVAGVRDTDDALLKKWSEDHPIIRGEICETRSIPLSKVILTQSM